MGILVGLACRDGLVVGSDSSRPGGAADPPFVHRPLAKTRLVGGDQVVAMTGPVGLVQRFEAVLRDLREDSRFHEWDHFVVARDIAAAALHDFASTHSDPAGFGALVGFVCATGIHLCQFAAGSLQPEFQGPDAWFASMGPARAAADSLLALAGRTLFAAGPPTLDQGTFAAAWALDHALRLHPGQAHGPVQIAVLSETSPETGYSARLLSPDELAELACRVQRAEQWLASLLQPGRQ